MSSRINSWRLASMLWAAVAAPAATAFAQQADAGVRITRDVVGPCDSAHQVCCDGSLCSQPSQSFAFVDCPRSTDNPIANASAAIVAGASQLHAEAHEGLTASAQACSAYAQARWRDSLMVVGGSGQYLLRLDLNVAHVGVATPGSVYAGRVSSSLEVNGSLVYASNTPGPQYSLVLGPFSFAQYVNLDLLLKSQISVPYCITVVPGSADVATDVSFGPLQVLDLSGNPLSSAWIGSSSGHTYGANSAPARVHVDPNAAPGGDGASWATAVSDLRWALELAKLPEVQELWIAQGTYRPDSGFGAFASDRNATFAVPSGTRVFGGFAGNESQLDQRAPGAHPTILSGDIGAPGVSTDNSHRVVTLSSTALSTTLDGLSIRDGRADNLATNKTSGAGIFASAASATLRGCTFNSNFAVATGAAIQATSTAAQMLVVDDCQFSGNTTGTGNYSGGGAIATLQNVSLQISDSTFGDNAAGVTGGALRLYGGAVSISDSLFEGNSTTVAGAAGGAIFQADWSGAPLASLVLERSRFTDNSSAGYGGALAISLAARPTIRECAFIDNHAVGVVAITATLGGGAIAALQHVAIERCQFVGNSSGLRGGAVHVASATASDTTISSSLFSGNVGGPGSALGGALRFEKAPPATDPAAVRSCTFSGNSAATGSVLSVGTGTARVDNSIVWAVGTTSTGIAGSATLTNCVLRVPWTGSGQGNLALDPQFRDAVGGDFRLGLSSPAIDAGSNAAAIGLTLDLNGLARFVDDCARPDTGAGSAPLIDIGAFESQGGNRGYTYGTAKTNSLGCVPAIELQGTCSASAPSGFVVRTTQLLNNKSAIPLYSLAGSSATPLGGGTLWIAAPRKRTAATNTSGNQGGVDCSGVVDFDFNTWIASGRDPALLPGQQVWMQIWSRDPGFGGSNAISLSDAATFVVCQ
ncbi:MAG: right-handed parallel beta-helix repeat-containing protein [Planctomycetes bacterium]|nr:right-handed parallel beta-helix repeat-containing protein [Planctomycetota bacterium]